MNRNNIPVQSVLHFSRLLCNVAQYLNISIILGIVLLLSTTMTAESNRITKANNQFGMDLFKIVANEDENKLISPFSAHVVLSMAYQGADGETSRTMAKVFSLPDAKTTANEYHTIINQLTKVKSVTLDVANKIYIKENFKLNPNFKQIIEQKFMSEAAEINFNDNQKAAALINGWVSNKTNNKISELIQANMLDASTSLVLLNAVYFKGNWVKKFDASKTVKKPFYLLNGDEIQVDMMHKSAKFRYNENSILNCKILELPYEGNELSMVIFLPNERNGITQLQDKLATVEFSSILQELSQFTVDVELPKFKIESTIPLKDALIELGAGNMFSDAADFKKMADEPLKVSDVIQKTFIEVNEEGAEAAAATGMRIMLMCMPPPPMEFSVNHPFTFALVDQINHSVLFLGNVLKPSIN